MLSGLSMETYNRPSPITTANTRMLIRNQGQNCLYHGGMFSSCCMCLPECRAHEAALGGRGDAVIIGRGNNESDWHVGALHELWLQLDVDRHLQQAAGLDGEPIGGQYQLQFRMTFYRQIEGAGLLTLVHDLDYVHVFDGPATGFPIQNVSVALHIQADLSHIANGEDEHADHQCQRGAVADQARTQDAGLLASHVVFGGVADQATVVTHLVHDVHTGVDTGRALDAFVLQAVADVDPGGADLYAHRAIDAIAQAQLGGFDALLARATVFAAMIVIGHHHGVLVEHHALEARVGAHVEAHLFAQPAGVDIGRRSEEKYPEGRPAVQVEGDQVDQQATNGREVTDKGQRGDQRHTDPQHMLGAAAQQLVGAYRRRVELDTRVALAFGDALGPHENPGPHGLRTGITAPDAPGEGGDEEQAEGADDQQEGQQKEVLWLKGGTEDMELACGQIPQHRLATV